MALEGLCTECILCPRRIRRSSTPPVTRPGLSGKVQRRITLHPVSFFDLKKIYQIREKERKIIEIKKFTILYEYLELFGIRIIFIFFNKRRIIRIINDNETIFSLDTLTTKIMLLGHHETDVSVTSVAGSIGRSSFYSVAVSMRVKPRYDDQYLTCKTIF